METKDLIIETAFLLFIENGYDRVSLNEIVRRTGLTKGAFYHSFSSKSELIQEVMRRYFFSHISNTINKIDGTGVTFEEKLIKVYQNVLKIDVHLSSYPEKVIGITEFMKLFYECVDMDDQLKKISFDQQLKIVETMKYAIEEGQKTGEIRDEIEALNLAELINASVRGIIMISSVFTKEELEEKIKKNMETMMLLIRK